MINWTKDSWEEVKFFLDELEYDYACDFEGNLILHFKSFDIVDENTKKVVDTVDHLWMLFQFFTDSYNIHWSRSDIYQSNPIYVHPHVNGRDHCTGSYVRGTSLCRDILYYTNYVKHYNSGAGWTSIPSARNNQVNSVALNQKLIPTFYMDLTTGHPMIQSVEFEGDLNEVVKEVTLKNPKSFFWKGEKYTQYNKGSRIEHINLKEYFDYAKYFERYNNSTSAISNVDVVSEIQ